ncbi:MAG: hypothetical protein ACI4M5_04395 [Christensenellales bacterium]
MKTTTNGTTVRAFNVTANNRGDDERTSILTIVTFVIVANTLPELYKAQDSVATEA